MFYSAVVLSKLLYEAEESCESECGINTPSSSQAKRSRPLTSENWQDETTNINCDFPVLENSGFVNMMAGT